ncbi:hypothetical protein [Amycolatopsis sp. NPDC059021]|uniref:hypothetical protein n=1 Tax=Amycolatopsis sp. NPDC059021 TaxID=3346704 RepID=UPI003671AABB
MSDEEEIPVPIDPRAPAPGKVPEKTEADRRDVPPPGSYVPFETQVKAVARPPSRPAQPPKPPEPPEPK